MNYKSGFTLIEILIVLVILGILASLSLPKITAAINNAYAGEAFKQLGKVIREVDMCFQLATEASECASFTDLGYNAAPETEHFTYQYNGAANKIIALCKIGVCSDATASIYADLISSPGIGSNINGKYEGTGDFQRFQFK